MKPLIRMNWTNYHGHSNYCDGVGSLEDYVIEAINLGMKSMGFSSHAPLSLECPWAAPITQLPSYLKETRLLKEKYKEQIQLYVGLEIDYIPGIMGPLHQDIVDLSLDYSVGSVHFVDQFPNGTHFEADGSRQVFVNAIDEIFFGNAKKLVCRYYELIREMLTESTPTILGHLDKIKIHNVAAVLFDEQSNWYKDEIIHTLDVLADSGVILEVNTRGIYKNKCSETYPSPWILKQAFSKCIPVTINSDAHHTREIISNFEFAKSGLHDAGYQHIWQCWDGKWVERELI